MGKRTSTMEQLVKDARKSKRLRTSTMAETLATANKGFKKQKKPTKTRTMAEIAQGDSAKKAKKIAKKAPKRKPTPKKSPAKQDTPKKGTPKKGTPKKGTPKKGPARRGRK